VLQHHQHHLQLQAGVRIVARHSGLPRGASTMLRRKCARKGRSDVRRQYAQHAASPSSVLRGTGTVSTVCFSGMGNINESTVYEPGTTCRMSTVRGSRIVRSETRRSRRRAPHTCVQLARNRLPVLMASSTLPGLLRLWSTSLVRHVGCVVGRLCVVAGTTSRTSRVTHVRPRNADGKRLQLRPQHPHQPLHHLR